MSAKNSPPKVVGVHHNAFRCRDAEETRHFYQDVLGLTLDAAAVLETGVQLTAAFAAEVGEAPAPEPVPVLTMFFGLGDGNYLTFFDAPHTVEEANFPVRDGVEEYHFAMEVGSWSDLVGMKQHLEASGVAVYGPMNHMTCHSIYCFDPNGINVEFTVRDKAHDMMMSGAATVAAETLARWTEDTSALKRERLAGSEALRAKAERTKRRMAEHMNAELQSYTPA